jgi:hypothetical protein
MLAGIAPPEVLAQTIARFAPGRPDAIAEVAGFPASDAARRSIGQVLHGHGGQRRRPPATGVAAQPHVPRRSVPRLTFHSAVIRRTRA